jgi:hypothetical protein
VTCHRPFSRRARRWKRTLALVHHQGARTGYVHRLAAAHSALGDDLRDKVAHAVIQHDSWCAIYKGGACDCVPDISLHPCDGGDVIVVDQEGRTKKLELS